MEENAYALPLIHMYRGQGGHALAMVCRPKLSGFDQRAGNGGLLIVLTLSVFAG
jgi:hypothetical protein